MASGCFELPEPSLRRWSSLDGATGGWPPLDGDAGDLLVVAQSSDLSVLHLLTAGGGELAVRRSVGGFVGEREAREHAVENGWSNFAVVPTHQLPGELRPGGL